MYELVRGKQIKRKVAVEVPSRKGEPGTCVPVSSLKMKDPSGPVRVSRCCSSVCLQGEKAEEDSHEVALEG